MMPQPIHFPRRYPRGVVLQFPCTRPMFSQTIVEPRSTMKKVFIGLMLLGWLAAVWSVLLCLAVFAWRAIR